MYNRSLAQINVQSMHTPKLFLLAKNKNTNEKMENKLNTVYSHQRLMEWLGEQIMAHLHKITITDLLTGGKSVITKC